MGIFDGLDVASAEDNPFDVVDGTYHCFVQNVKVGPTAKGDKSGMTLVYQIDEADSPMNGRQITEWQEIPGENTANAARTLSFLKSRLKSLGVPESRMNSIETDDLMNVECVVSVAKRGEYTNVTRVSLPSGTTANAAAGSTRNLAAGGLTFG